MYDPLLLGLALKADGSRQNAQETWYTRLVPEMTQSSKQYSPTRKLQTIVSYPRQFRSRRNIHGDDRSTVTRLFHYVSGNIVQEPTIHQQVALRHNGREDSGHPR